MTMDRSATLYRIAMPLALLGAGWGIAMGVPRGLPVGATFATLAAVWGTMRSPNAHMRAVVRHALLAASAFGYPLFLAGTFLPWCMAAIHLLLVAAGWMPTLAGRPRLIMPQALAGGFGIALIAAATQFFFPSAWRWVAGAALAAFLALLTVSMPLRVLGRFPSPLAGVIVLALAEGLVILRYLPTHWVINGTMLTLALAAAIEHRRAPRVMFAGLLVGMFLFGVLSA